MNSRRGIDDSCICSDCLYKRNKAFKGIERTGSKIDKLYRDKYLPLRESNLIDKLERTRAVYDDIRAPFLAESDSKRHISNKKRKESDDLHKCCSCCRCLKKGYNISGDTDVSSEYGHVRQNKRRVRFKPEFTRSEPCLCLAKFSNLLKKQSELVQSKLKRDFSAPVLSNKIKEATSKQKSRVGKVFNKAHKKLNTQAKSVICECQELGKKISDSKTQLETMLKLSVKKLRKSRDMAGDIRHKNNLNDLDHRLCPCPQEKLVLKIRKDSIRKFYEDLEKKRTLKYLECKSECIEDICIPKHCLDKIKMTKGRKSKQAIKSVKHQKKSPKQKKSLKQIVLKASRRKKKKSTMCQCDDTTAPTKVSEKQQAHVRKKKIKFSKPDKETSRVKSSVKSPIATLPEAKPKSKDDGGNTLKRCFCTLKFKPKGMQDLELAKYSSTTEPLNDYPYSGQSGNKINTATRMPKIAKKASKNKSIHAMYDCDPKECLNEYYNRKRLAANPLAKSYKNDSHTYNVANQPKLDLHESDKDNRRVLRIGSSISFNIEFFKENIPKDTIRSVKTNTVPRYLSNKSIKSLLVQKSKKKMFKHKSKKKVVIMDTQKPPGTPEQKEDNLKKQISGKFNKRKAKGKQKIKTAKDITPKDSFEDNSLENKISGKINKKKPKGKQKIKADKDITPKDSFEDNSLKADMVDQSTKITNKDMRFMKSYACEPHICVPDNCDPYICLENIKKRYKHVNTTTDLPKMKSVSSAVHEQNLKHLQFRSKSSFRSRKSFAESDVKPFDDNAQIQTITKQTLPDRNGQKSGIRISSNFSFAIEIGKGMVPHVNPIETIKRYSSIYRSKIKKPRANNNSIKNKNKSKNSLMNTMVKRCMCTLNLSKQRNKNKPPNKVTGNFASNVYTVNTVMTSNVGSFLTKRMSEHKLRYAKRASKKHKFDIRNSYATWHSQVICNYLHVSQRKNIVSKKLLKKHGFKRHLKNNLYLVSKSLSFLSDSQLKKKAEYRNWNPWHYAESKNITLYKSSDYTSNMYHVGRHHTFTKSSKYWEKSYCTMNLRTVYNRNGQLKKRIDNDSQKNAVRVGSNINLNIEFYKDTSCLEPKHEMLPARVIRKQSISNKMIQGENISTSNKTAYSAPDDQRCFCTLKLQKKNANHFDMPKEKPPLEFNLQPTVSYVNKSQNTHKTKKLKNIPKDITTAEKEINTIKRFVPKEQFIPRECIPGMCIPGQCNPASCYEILYKRKLNTRSTSAATKKNRKKRAGVLTQRSSFKNARTQSQKMESQIEARKRTYKQTSVPNNNVDSEKQCVKLGSNISFSIEFFKENSPSNHIVHKEPEVYDRRYSKSRKQVDAFVTTETQDLKHKKVSAKPAGSLLKRCFCTLKLQSKKKKQPILTKVHSVGVMAGVKNKWYSDKVLANKDITNKGDTTNIYKTKSILRKQRGTKSKHKNQHIAMAALLPYECEPGTCIPGACNPYECLQRIKGRKLAKKDIGSVTMHHNKKSLGTSSKYRIPSKHRRIQTTTFERSDMEVSLVVPKKIRRNTDTSPPNNQCVRIGSNINFSIEFFREKNCDRPHPNRTIYKDTDVVKTSPSRYGRHMKTKSVMSHIKKKSKKTKHTLNKSQEPIVNYQVNSKKQTLSQLSQTRQKYFSKNKGLLPYECEPNVCIPGQCDPYKCYELIQNRLYRDCSAVTVENVRDFAANATPCYTCKSKRIQTGYCNRDGGGVSFMKSVLDHKSRNYVRISSNFGFHIEICKKGDQGSVREVEDHVDNYKHKKIRDHHYMQKGQSRLHDQASQSQYTKRRSQSTFANSKLQRCFCTKSFFNSSASANRNYEYTTNCAFVPNIPKISNPNNISNNRDSQRLITPFYLHDQKKYDEPTRKLKNKIKSRRLPKLGRSTSKTLVENKIKSYLSFDLELFKRKTIKVDSNNNIKKQICSDQHIFIPKKQRNVQKFKGLKTIDSKSIQGQGDSEKRVSLKKCRSTINFRRNIKTESDLVNSSHVTIQQALQTNVCLKYICTDSSGVNTFIVPRAKVLRWDEVNESLFNSSNMRFLCNTNPGNKIFSIKNHLIEIKKYNNENYNGGSKEKCGYFRNVYDKVHLYVHKLSIKRLFQNIKSRQSNKITETAR